MSVCDFCKRTTIIRTPQKHLFFYGTQRFDNLAADSAGKDGDGFCLKESEEDRFCVCAQLRGPCIF